MGEKERVAIHFQGFIKGLIAGWVLAFFCVVAVAIAYG